MPKHARRGLIVAWLPYPHRSSLLAEQGRHVSLMKRAAVHEGMMRKPCSPVSCLEMDGTSKKNADTTEHIGGR